MSLSHVTSKSPRSASLSTLSGKDTNLTSMRDELDIVIVSLTAAIKKQRDSLATVVATNDEWVQRVSKVEGLLRENKVETFLSAAQEKALDDLLSRAKNYARSSTSTAEELTTEIKTCENHLEAAQEAKGKIALLLVTKKLDFFPRHGMESADAKTDYVTSRELRSVIATAQALISLREGK